MKTTQIKNQNNQYFIDCEKFNNTNVGDILLLENKHVKVWSIHIPMGKSIHFHKHNKPYFYVALNDGKSKSYYNDGRVVVKTYQKQDLVYFGDLSDDNYFIHNLENIGQTPLSFITVELLNQ